jgi:hypothetical protein
MLRVIGTACSWLNLRRCSPRWPDANDNLQDDLVGSEILGNRVGCNNGDGGIGGRELRFRDGMYTRGSDFPLSGVCRTGELCLRDNVPVEFTKVSLEARGWVIRFSSLSDFRYSRRGSYPLGNVST